LIIVKEDLTQNTGNARETGICSFEVSGDKTKPRASSLGGNLEEVAEMQSEVPHSKVKFGLIGQGWIKT
jgi:hypothetical protein